MDLATLVPAILGEHPLVEEVRLAGSRAGGTSHTLSDWDFVVTARDFEGIAEDLPRLVAPLRPLAAQWDRYSDHACYMLMLRGPAKIDLIFPDVKQPWAPAWDVSAKTLPAVDRHFWDWILWLEQKRRAGKEDALAKSLGDMYELMLEPMGAASAPRSIPEAVELFLDLREKLEERYGVAVPRKLEREVRPVLGGGVSPRIEKGSD